MKRRLLLLGALLVLGAFFLHIGAMLPSREALVRAEALEYLLAQDDPAVLETLAPFLDGEAELRGEGEVKPWIEGGERVGDRMLREADRLYYIRPGSAQVIVFALDGGG